MQGVASDGPGVVAVSSIKIRIPAMPLAAGPEFYDRQIPGDDYGDDAFLVRLKRETHSDGASERFVAAGVGIVAVGEAAVFGERFPHGFAVAAGVEGGLIRDFHAGSFESGDGKLAIPGFSHRADMVAIEDDALHGPGRTQRFGGDAIEVSLTEAAAEIVTEGS